MKKLFIATFLIFYHAAVCADAFYIGGKEIVIPSPQGFSRVNNQMNPLYRLSLQGVDPINDQLAFYISDSDVPAAKYHLWSDTLCSR